MEDYYEQEYTAFEEELLDTINGLEMRIWELEGELENAMERIYELEQDLEEESKYI